MSEITSSFPFATAKIKAMESKLITRDKLNRVIEAKDFDSAMRILQEIGYGQSLSGKASFEELIQTELSEVDDLMVSISPSDVFIKIVRAQKDYYNLKVLIKLLMLGKSLDSIPLSPGNIRIEILQRAITENNYLELHQPMKEALGFIDKQFSVATDISVIGIALDRAYAKEIILLIDEMNNPLIRDYFQAYFDLSNIIAFMRVRQSSHDKDSFEKAYLKGGAIEKRIFSEAFESSDDHLLGTLIKGDYASGLAAAFSDYKETKSLYMLEKTRDDYLLEMLKKHKNDMFGIGPLMCYYIAKQREAAAVRMVMTAKQGGIDSAVVSKRLKELY